MLPEYFALVSMAVASLGTLYYLWLTIIGRVQPNRVTYFFWGVFPLITFFAQAHLEVSSVLWITLSVGILPMMILLVSFINPKAYWELSSRDYVLGMIAVVAMGVWYVTNNPLLAIVFTLLADVFAGLPTLIKSYTSPLSEDWRPYALDAFGFLIGVLSVQQWVFAEYAFVLYLFIMTSLFAIVIYMRTRQLTLLTTSHHE